jgi:hypothetical protein
MAKFTPVSSTQHAGKAWRRPIGYAFASTQAVVPLVSAEFGRVAVSMPIAFIQQAGRYVPVAVMSPVAGRNFFVGPNGQWLGTYVPAAFGAYPFRFARIEEKDDSVLCVEEDSVATEGTGESFFDADGQPSPATKVALELLTKFEGGRAITEAATAALAEAGMIEPWSFNITIEGATAEEQQVKPMKDLYRINEGTLNALDDQSFLKLRKSWALPLAYLQILSMGQLSVFTLLARRHQQLALPKRELPVSLDAIFAAAENETIRFK